MSNTYSGEWSQVEFATEINLKIRVCVCVRARACVKEGRCQYCSGSSD